MQWKSFVFLFATAGSALARSHGNHHRHGARHQHDNDATAVYIDEPLIVTETVWACCTSSALSLSTPTVPATFIETSSSTQTPTQTPTSTPTPTPTPEPTSEEPTSTSTSTPTPSPEPETTSSSTSTVAPTSTEAPTSTSAADHSLWTNTPSSDDFCLEGFGERTAQLLTGNKDTYAGNVGTPWGSNIIEVSPEKAADYKYVVQFRGSKTDPLFVAVWNKIGPDMKMTGWYNGNAAVKFTLQPNEIRYVAFDENTQGSWGAAKGTSLPVDAYGGYSCTWGEFDVGSTKNKGWSGFDASIIQAEAALAAKAANQPDILGMKICTADDSSCSIIGKGGSLVKDAYAFKDRWVDGIGGKLVPGPVRLVAHLDYDE